VCRSGRRLLIPYITAGYPDPEGTPGLLRALVRAGADVIELGVPFSDPVADGPTIQRSSQRALERGVTLAWVLGVLREFRAGGADTPVVLFTYLNPVLRFGVDRFVTAAAEAGADGVLITDLPAGADPDLEKTLGDSALAHIRLVAPTTPPVRARELAAGAQGFLYYISRLGVTGATRNLRAELAGEVMALRAAASVPIAVGFGVSTGEQAAALGRIADGVVVGSALIDALDRGGTAAAEALLDELRAGLDGRIPAATSQS
jgi:tryptophan synthase alpha chain